MAHGYRPELADIFPDSDGETVRVENEKHRYEVFEGDSGSKLPKYEYTLNKAPVIRVEEVTGISNGNTTTFSQGSDYALNPLVSERYDTFVFRVDKLQYTLTTIPDDNTVTVEDEDGNAYTEGTDFEIVKENGDENILDWSIGGSQPEDQTGFTATYEVTFEDSVIDWDQGGDTPDAGTFFEVTYVAESIISRYLSSDAEELKSVEDQLDEIIKSKFIDTASGEELDRIGETFGVLGKRRGRSDTQYRTYLKSVVQSFVSRGTKEGIKTAVSAATDVPKEDITINEDFTNNSYEVQVVAATPITGSLLEEVAEIADPSGVEQSLTRFTLPDEEIGINDSTSFSEGTLTEDDARVDDAVFINPNKFPVGPDEMGVDDAFAIDPNKFLSTEDVGLDDTVATTRGSATDDMVADDAVDKILERDKNTARWEPDRNTSDATEWNFFEWTEYIDLTTTTADDVGSADAVVVDANAVSTTDTGGSADATAIDANVTTVAEGASTDDAVTVTFNQTKVAEGTGAGDGVTAVTSSVAWGSNWNNFNWGGAVEAAFE